jgi:radical SAM protein with 4Fe4S-binding SPASM domain
MMDEIIRYIAQNKNGGKDSVVFFGGEPLLEYQVIDEFVRKSASMNLSYLMYTNGLLLNHVPPNTFQALDTIFISIDGDSRSHDRHRGEGTYQRIVENLRDMRPKVKSRLVGRITAEEETNIYVSVMNILEDVDAVHWQIVNKPEFKDPARFIDNYCKNLTDLFDFWLSGLRNGTVYNIVPFQAVASSVVFGYKKGDHSFRCNCGHSFQAIDIDGSIYWCDEFVGNPEGVIGNVGTGTAQMSHESHKSMFEDCRYCRVSDICLGRCKKCLMNYSPKHIRNYCRMSTFLIDTILDRKDEIENIIRVSGYSMDAFYPLAGFTEEIP